MENNDIPIPRKKKEKKLAIKKRKTKSVKSAAAAEKGRTHGIDRINIVETVHEAENDSVQGE